ncbi:MAG: hypothetical protein AB7K68_13675 [Bacteriovoracia bacterium]
MELHGSRLEGRRQEIRCSDCGHTYLIAEGQLSSRCTHCGNISAHAVSPAPEAALVFRETIVPGQKSPLDAFQKLPDGLKVQEVLSRYQIEWQLWSVLVRNFSDPVYHAAYLSQAIAASAISEASERYRMHRSAMVLLRDDHWQAEVADLMLTRLERLSLLRMQQTERVNYLYLRWAELMADQPLRAKLIRFGWFVAGMSLFLRLVLPLFNR